MLVLQSNPSPHFNTYREITIMKTKHTLLSLIAIVGLSLANVSFADMSLDKEHSNVSFVSVKKGTAAEGHRIRNLSGTLTDKGKLNVTLDLTSVDTKIEIRDQRAKEFLFETGKFAEATLTANIEGITDGVKNISTEAELSLHGVSQKIKVDVTVFKAGDKLLATSTMPIIIKAADFKMEGGVKKLQELAKLPSVATAVPVSFVLTFTK